MFLCENGHTTEPGQVLVKRPLEFRPVQYRLEDEKGDIVSQFSGTEIAQEGNFCSDHAEDADAREAVLLDEDPKVIVQKV